MDFCLHLQKTVSSCSFYAILHQRINDETVTIENMLLGQAIASLPPMRREVILLSYFLGKNDPQIAKQLNLTPNAIRYRRQTTLQRLKKILEVLADEK